MRERGKCTGTAHKEVPSKQRMAVEGLVAAWLTVLMAFVVIVGLYLSGFISKAFLLVLVAVDGCYGVFKTGYFWRDIKF